MLYLLCNNFNQSVACCNTISDSRLFFSKLWFNYCLLANQGSPDTSYPLWSNRSSLTFEWSSLLTEFVRNRWNFQWFFIGNWIVVSVLVVWPLKMPLPFFLSEIATLSPRDVREILLVGETDGRIGSNRTCFKYVMD